MAKIKYQGRELEILYDVDCCVAGGGTAGVAAGIMAGRSGAKTLIVERGLSLGGSQTLGLVGPMMPSLAPDSDTPYIKEIKEKFRARGTEIDDGKTGTYWTNPDVLTEIYDELTDAENIDVLYNATLMDAIVKNGEITHIVVMTVAGLAAIKAKIFIDGTGDALLARLSGVPAEAGYEKTGYNQPMSFRFEMGGVDINRLDKYLRDELKDPRAKTKPPYVEIGLARHREMKYAVEPLFIKGMESGELTEEDAEYFQAFSIPGKDGFVLMNCPELPVKYRATEPISYSAGVKAGRRMMRRIAAFAQKHLPGFENAYISREASMLGARESWRIVGKYRVTVEDYYARQRFPDAVARTAWYIDAHGEKVGEYLKPGEFYEIPYRAMVMEEINNLIVAGRAISADFFAQASLRIQPTCMSMGEAAGIAAGCALKNKIAPAELKWQDVPREIRSYISAIEG